MFVKKCNNNSCFCRFIMFDTKEGNGIAITLNHKHLYAFTEMLIISSSRAEWELEPRLPVSESIACAVVLPYDTVACH